MSNQSYVKTLPHWVLLVTNPSLFLIVVRHETVGRLGIVCQLLFLAHMPKKWSKMFLNAPSIRSSMLECIEIGGKEGRERKWCFGVMADSYTLCSLNPGRRFLLIWLWRAGRLSLALGADRHSPRCHPAKRDCVLAGVLWRCQPIHRHYISTAARRPVSQ